jgi:hypothetical protein
MRLVAFFLACLLLAGCQSKPMTYLTVLGPKGTVDEHRSKESTADKIASFRDREPEVAQESSGSNSVRQGETIKAYGVNRYVDARDSRMMHERHAVYRLEQQPAWLTRSPKSQNEILLGPVVGLKKPEYAPEPLPGETARDLVTTKHKTEQAAEDIKVVREGQEKLAASVQSLAKQTVEAQQKLTTIVSVLNDRVKRLEGENSEAPPAAANNRDENNVVIRGSNQ